ncbi:hypothetical protein B9W62_27550 [Streptomyces sp. CS113]|nr:hypothetical protein B9W62_27550 [Streptomyces sp. CS113]
MLTCTHQASTVSVNVSKPSTGRKPAPSTQTHRSARTHPWATPCKQKPPTRASRKEDAHHRNFRPTVLFVIGRALAQGQAALTTVVGNTVGAYVLVGSAARCGPRSLRTGVVRPLTPGGSR